MRGDRRSRFKQLVQENARLKKLVAEILLDKQVLQDVARGYFETRVRRGEPPAPPTRPLWTDSVTASSWGAKPAQMVRLAAINKDQIVPLQLTGKVLKDREKVRLEARKKESG